MRRACRTNTDTRDSVRHSKNAACLLRATRGGPAPRLARTAPPARTAGRHAACEAPVLRAAGTQARWRPYGRAARGSSSGACRARAFGPCRRVRARERSLAHGTRNFWSRAFKRECARETTAGPAAPCARGTALAAYVRTARWLTRACNAATRRSRTRSTPRCWARARTTRRTSWLR